MEGEIEEINNFEVDSRESRETERERERERERENYKKIRLRSE